MKMNKLQRKDFFVFDDESIKRWPGHVFSGINLVYSCEDTHIRFLNLLTLKTDLIQLGSSIGLGADIKRLVPTTPLNFKRTTDRPKRIRELGRGEHFAWSKDSKHNNSIALALFNGGSNMRIINLDSVFIWKRYFNSSDLSAEVYPVKLTHKLKFRTIK